MHVQNQGLTLFIAILWKTERVHSRALNTSNIASSNQFKMHTGF